MSQGKEAQMAFQAHHTPRHKHRGLSASLGRQMLVALANLVPTGGPTHLTLDKPRGSS